MRIKKVSSIRSAGIISLTVISSLLSICLLSSIALGEPTAKDTDSIVVFDALQYNTEKNQNITEEEITKVSHGDVLDGGKTESKQAESIEDLFPIICGIVLLLFIAVFCFVMFSKTSKARKVSKQNYYTLLEQGLLQQIGAKHTYGLPIAEGLFCTVRAFKDHFDFISGNIHVSLLNEKIIDICTKTETEIQQQYVSSVGGAVGGAVVFGALGAMIGGRAKKKETRTTTIYMIITYKNAEDNIAYIGFDVSSCYFQAQKIIDEFNKKNNNGCAHIEL